jgi:hypothetical protein
MVAMVVDDCAAPGLRRVPAAAKAAYVTPTEPAHWPVDRLRPARGRRRHLFDSSVR